MGSPPKHNIVIFGESGSGKSSIVNMIVGEPVAKVSSSLVGRTSHHGCYATSIGNTHFNIYDTVGLNEGDRGRVPHWEAIHKLYTLIRSLDGVSLLIYCMQGHVQKNARANWILFHDVLCAKKVPILAVETGLEYERDLDVKRAMLRKELDTHGMVHMGVACIVSVLGRNREHEKRYMSSQDRLRQLIMDSYKREPWSTTTGDWIGHIYKTTFITKLWLFPDVRVDFANEVGNVVDEFIEEVGMEKGESTKLKSTLLDAETKLRRKRSR